jgi:aspartate/methionine/tyrosine aminotransferase
MNKASHLEKSQNAKIIHLEVGQPNFPTPSHIINATVDALMQNKTSYIPNGGIWELRTAVGEMYQSENLNTLPNQVVITVGSTLSIFSLMMCLLSVGDNCLLPLPGFPNYQLTAAMLNAETIPYMCLPSNNYLPTAESIEDLINKKTKCIVLNNPGNPSGAVYSKELLREILMVAKKHNLFVISDGNIAISLQVIFDIILFFNS